MSNGNSAEAGLGLAGLIALIPVYMNRDKILKVIFEFLEKLFIFIAHILVIGAVVAAAVGLLYSIYKGIKSMMIRRKRERELEKVRIENEIYEVRKLADKAMDRASELAAVVRSLNAEVEGLKTLVQQAAEDKGVTAEPVDIELEVE